MQELENFIKDLSIADKKNLCQKTLKISEELGELSDRVLAFEEAPQHLHKIADGGEILEESVDVLLAAFSVPLSLGFDFSEIYSMMLKKANKWQGLQHQEKHDKFVFEIHLYFKIDNDALDTFKNDCVAVGTKAIIVDNESGKNLSRDVMTSSKVYGSYKDAENHSKKLISLMGDIATENPKYYHKPFRKKIEVATNHPLANISMEDMRQQGMYFESHIQVLLFDEKEREDLIILLSSIHSDFHLSKNPFKKVGNGFVQMVNVREQYTTKEMFEQQISNVYLTLLNKQFQVLEKPELEFCVFDDNKDKSNF